MEALGVIKARKLVEICVSDFPMENSCTAAVQRSVRKQPFALESII